MKQVTTTGASQLAPNPPGTAPHKYSRPGAYDVLLDPPALTLDEEGHIVNCCDACAELFGYGKGDLVDHHISTLFPQLAEIPLLTNGHINSMLDFLCRCNHTFIATTRDGASFRSAFHLVQLYHPTSVNLRLLVRPLE